MRRSSKAGTLAVIVAVLAAPLPAAADDLGGSEPVDITQPDQSVDRTPPERESGVTVARVGASVLDAIVLRPLGFAATVGGMIMFMASAPLVAPSQELPTTWDIFVLGPYDYTFLRPLGDF